MHMKYHLLPIRFSVYNINIYSSSTILIPNTGNVYELICYPICY